MGAVDRKRPHDEIARPAHMHAGQRPVRPVLDDIASRRLDTPVVRIERDIEDHVRDARLRHVFIAHQRLFVVGSEVVVADGGAIFIENVGVVVDEGTRAGEDYEGDGHDDARGAHQPSRQSRQARAEPRLGATPPKAIGEHRQHHHEGAVIELEPVALDPELAFPVHVRQRHFVGRKLVEAMLEAHLEKGDAGHEVERHQAPAPIFVRRHGLDEDRKRRKLDRPDRLRNDVPQEIVVEFEEVITLDRLDRDGDRHRDDESRNQHQRDGCDLRHDEDPVRYRAGIEDFVGAPVALAPDELAGIIDGDDDRDEGEGAPERVDHHPGHRKYLIVAERIRNHSEPSELTRPNASSTKKAGLRKTCAISKRVHFRNWVAVARAS